MPHFPMLRMLNLNNNNIATYATMSRVGELLSVQELRANANPLQAGQKELDARLLLIATCPRKQTEQQAGVTSLAVQELINDASPPWLLLLWLQTAVE